MPKRMMAIISHPTTVSDYPPPYVVPEFLQPALGIPSDIHLTCQNQLTFKIAVDDLSTPPNSKIIHGHGTQVAIFAGGCKTGVARKANLFLIKMVEAMMKDGLVEELMTGPNAQLQALRTVAAVAAGNLASVSVPRGKAVLVMSTGNWREDNMRIQAGARWEGLKAQMKTALERLDYLGVTIVMAAGNDGSTSNPQDPDFVPRYIDQQFPQGLATEDSPMLLVGATNSKGQLSAFTTPGRGNIAVSLYAQGEAASSYDLHENGPKLRSGTSFAAPIVVRSIDPKCLESVVLTDMFRLDWLPTRLACPQTHAPTTPSLPLEKIRWACV